MIGEIAQMLGVLLAVPVSDRIGKKGTFIAVLAVVSVLSVLVWFLPETASGFWMLLLLQVLIGLAVGVNSPMLWSMFADVADYSELKHGNPSTGLIFSSSSMAQKFGGALGAFLLMQILAWSDYDATLAQQSEGTLRAIKALMSFVPAAGSLLGLLCLVFYPLGSAKMRAVQSELETKRNK
jgi:GPH family glycoside/pentoside/hexuronide:cation symporter